MKKPEMSISIANTNKRITISYGYFDAGADELLDDFANLLIVFGFHPDTIQEIRYVPDEQVIELHDEIANLKTQLKRKNSGIFNIKDVEKE